MSGCDAQTVIAYRNARVFTARSAALLSGSLFCLGCGNGSSSSHESIAARLGNECFAVPSEYAGALDAPPFLPGIVSQLGYTHMRLLLPSTELAKAVSGYISVDATREIVVGVSVLTDVERSRFSYRALNYDKDLWFGTGAYSQRTIESAQATSYFRVCLHERYCLLVNADPRSASFDANKPGVLVASCTRSHATDVPLCVVAVAANDRAWMLEFGLGEENVSHRQAVAEYILHKIDSWQRPC